MCPCQSLMRRQSEKPLPKCCSAIAWASRLAAAPALTILAVCACSRPMMRQRLDSRSHARSHMLPAMKGLLVYSRRSSKFVMSYRSRTLLQGLQSHADVWGCPAASTCMLRGFLRRVGPSCSSLKHSMSAMMRCSTPHRWQTLPTFNLSSILIFRKSAWLLSHGERESTYTRCYPYAICTLVL